MTATVPPSNSRPRSPTTFAGHLHGGQGHRRRRRAFLQGQQGRIRQGIGAGRHIVLPIPPNASEADKSKVREKLQEIRMMLQNDPKADFAELAKQYSKDPQASPGGDLGWFPRKWVFEESFSRAAFSLRVGQVSDIVETQIGYHLIKVTDRKPGEPSEFGKIKEAVGEFYLWISARRSC